MAGPTYVARVVSSTTGLPVVELPIQDGTYTRLRSAAGAFAAKIKLNTSDALGRLDLVDNTRNNEVEVAIERNGRLVYSGLLIDAEYDSNTEQLSISGRESWCYFDRRLVEWDLSYSAVDQGSIVQDVLTRAAGSPGGDWRVDLPSAAALSTGVMRTLAYLAVDCKPISELIEEMGALASGFEFSLDPYWASGQLRHQLNFGSPLLGVRGGGLAKWTLPGTIKSYRWQRQGGAQATEIFGIGDDAAGHVRLQRVKSLALNLPLLQLPVSFRAITQSGSLLDWTRQKAAASLDPVVVAYVTVVGGLHPQMDEVNLGDDVTFQFNDAFMQGVASLFRLAGYTVTMPKSGQPETVELLVDAAAASLT